MTTQRDYYDILGIHRDATEADIKTAYRRLAMKYHPDRNPAGNQEAEHHFKEAKEAYEILSDPQKRQAYDRFGHAGVQGGMSGGHGGRFNDIFESIFGDFGDIFGGGRHDAAHRGADLRYDLSITLEQAVFGTTVDIDFPAQTECETCKGSGAKPGTQRETCTDCEGHGQIRMQRGFFTVQQTCPTCRGEGQIIKTPCASCRGQGRIRKTKHHHVTIPAGVDDGDRIRLNGEGEAGVHHGPAGDLYVCISVKPHDIFKREQSHLFCEVPISFVVAVLGGEIDVPTLTGKMKLKIPPETQSGKVFRLRGKGIKPAREHSTGDLLCRIVIETPVNLTNQQKEWLRQFETSTQSNAKAHTPKAHSWFESVKRFFEGSKN